MKNRCRRYFMNVPMKDMATTPDWRLITIAIAIPTMINILRLRAMIYLMDQKYLCCISG